MPTAWESSQDSSWPRRSWQMGIGQGSTQPSPPHSGRTHGYHGSPAVFSRSLVPPRRPVLPSSNPAFTLA
ncbi:hypothetical protein MUK42_32783 [Musa troglodytarum]|uniref:Uncharacterized protein n=1 Tax=Musa troglodytarum TaxID=320322 RepID=A0A9E7HD71_9LILI|nr:hypothetical protein MUK42_32783 [Musa troglodytarum]